MKYNIKELYKKNNITVRTITGKSTVMIVECCENKKWLDIDEYREHILSISKHIIEVNPKILFINAYCLHYYITEADLIYIKTLNYDSIKIYALIKGNNLEIKNRTLEKMSQIFKPSIIFNIQQEGYDWFGKAIKKKNISAIS